MRIVALLLILPCMAFADRIDDFMAETGIESRTDGYLYYAYMDLQQSDWQWLSNKFAVCSGFYLFASTSNTALSTYLKQDASESLKATAQANFLAGSKDVDRINYLVSLAQNYWSRNEGRRAFNEDSSISDEFLSQSQECKDMEELRNHLVLIWEAPSN